MTNLTDLIATRTQRHCDAVVPNFFRLSDSSDRESFAQLLAGDDSIEVIDTIDNQLKELIRLRRPSKKYEDREMEEALTSHLGSIPIEEYGVWVHYPWRRLVVHLLDELEFVEVRTNRNLYKITPEEHETLSKKKIGVIGLSVGKSVATTLAMERAFGELRIADFDDLELTNMNRINTSVSNLRIPKTTIVAREISEFDPYLKVKIFDQGISEDNLDDFLTEGGNLDLLVEECDEISIKIISRLKARELRIPVIMETSDRGMIDIERFDLEPERLLFHGLVEEVDVESIRNLSSNEEKIPFVLPIAGVDTMSPSLKASMIEVGESIETWPQLASSVMTGTGFAAKYCRKILLEQNHSSGRYFFDQLDDQSEESESELDTVEETIADNSFRTTEDVIAEIKSSFPVASLPDSCNTEDIQRLIRSATLAPSGGNCQPWIWFERGNCIFLIHNIKVSESLLDSDRSGSYISFGAALFNMELESEAVGIRLSQELWPDPTIPELVARIIIEEKSELNGKVNPNGDLVQFIEERRTNRNICKRTNLQDDLLVGLNSIKHKSDVDISFLTDFPKIDQLGDLFAEGEMIRLFNERGHKEFFEEIRWNDAEAFETRTGIDIKTIQLTPLEHAGMLLLRNHESIRWIRKLGMQKGEKLRALTRKYFNSASALCLISASNRSNLNLIESGRVLQEVWLKATKLKIQFQPVTAPLFLQNASMIFPEYFHNSEVESLKKLRDEVCALFKLDGQEPLFLARIFEGDEPHLALRRRIEDVHIVDNS